MNFGYDVLFLLGGGLLVGGGIVALLRLRRQRTSGRLLRSDLSSRPAPILWSSRLRFSGRPDELRELSDGRWVPVEIKSRPAPRAGPLSSHRIQLGAYCLLVEETTGRAPPFGLLRYGDGNEFRIDWDARLRSEVLAVRRELAAPYDGRANPGPARCGRCPWRASCDRAAA